VISILQLKVIIRVAAVSAGAALCGCTVGPDYRAPAPPDVQGYTSKPMPTETSSAPVKGGESQRLVLGKDIPERWWSLFRSEALDHLIRLALKNNPTTAAAQATLRQAEENLRAQYGAGRLPAVDMNLSASREKFSGAAFGQSGSRGTIFNLYNASVNVSYLFDIFGGVTRELEALQSQVDYQRFQLEGTYLTLSANIVTTVVQEASLRARLQATQEILSEEEKLYSVVQAQFQLGSVSRSDVLAQLTQLSQTRSTVPPLEKELSQNRHLLAVLLGKFPNDAGKLPELNLDSLILPRELPVSLPSDLARQRPDVGAAEALLHAASAQVGVATANLYPKVTLTGSYGSETTTLGDLFNTNTLIWNLGAGLLQPLFHGGELSAKRRAAVAAYDQALAVYRMTVLQAFKDVADVLRALEADASALKAEAQAADAARKSLDLTKEQFRLGAVSYLTLLNAQRQYQQTRIGLIQAQATRFADTAALFQALGGGWWHPVPDTGARTVPGAEKD
jgi:NodT family efflux transporter outer membrane factor (OMF) lipoprotein